MPSPASTSVPAARPRCVILTDGDAAAVQAVGVAITLIGRVDDTSAAYSADLSAIEAVATPRDGWELHTGRPIPMGCAMPLDPARGLAMRAR